MADDEVAKLLQDHYGHLATDPDFLREEAHLAPARPFPGPPSLYQGSITNPGSRPQDYMTPVAEAISPTLGGYGLGQGLAETGLNLADHEWAKAAEVGVPMALGIFAGPGARTANLGMLARAQEMAAKGLHKDAIWKETGWFKGPDEKWAWEIPDNEAANVAKGYSGGWSDNSTKTLPDVLGHDQLYEAYPHLEGAGAAWKVGPKAVEEMRALRERGGYFPETATDGEGFRFRAADKDGLVPTMLHEVQHAVNQKEAFPAGSSPELAVALKEDATRRLGELLPRIARMRDQAPTGRDDLSGKAAALQAAEAEAARLQYITSLTPDEIYKRSAGEVQARNVEERRRLTPEQRRATPPWETEDVPSVDQILTKHYGPQMSVPVKNSGMVHADPTSVGSLEKVTQPGAAGATGRELVPPKQVGTDAAGRPMYDFRNSDVVHYTDPESAADIASGGYRVVGDGYYGQAVSFTPDRAYARSFGGTETAGRVAPDAKILNTANPDDWAVVQSVMNNPRYAPVGRPGAMGWRERFLELGYDGLYDPGAGDLFMYNPAKVTPHRSPSPQTLSGEGTTLGGAFRSPESSNTITPYVPSVPVGAGSKLTPEEYGLPTKGYHGTLHDFNEFQVNPSDYMVDRGLGVHFAKDPEVSNSFVMERVNGRELGPKEGGRVIQARLPDEGKMLAVEQPVYDAYKDMPNRKSHQGVKSDQVAIEQMIAIEAYRKDPSILARYLMEARRVPEADAVPLALAMAKGETVHIPLEEKPMDLRRFVDNYGGKPFNEADRKLVTELARKSWMEQGYRGLKYLNTSPMEMATAKDPTSYIVFDPADIRSFSAGFDPAHKGSADFMKSRGGRT